MGKVPNLLYSKDEPATDVAKRLGLQKDDYVETKTFEAGYRGSWFRCQIKAVETSYRNHVRYKLQFVHFPDEALHWCQAYQQRLRGQDDSFELMVRPAPPPVVHEQNAHKTSFGGTIIITKPWEIGDFVDWNKEDAWWEGTVVGFMPGGKLKVSLFEPPHGEGGTYEVEAEELRPTLSWNGVGKWSIDISTINGRAAGKISERPHSIFKQELKSNSMKEESPIEVEGIQDYESDVKIFPSLGKLRDAVRSLTGEAEAVPNEGIAVTPLIPERGGIATSLIGKGDDGVTPLKPERDGPANPCPLIPEDDMNPVNTADHEESYSNLEYIQDILYVESLTGKRRNRKFLRYRRQIRKYIAIKRELRWRTFRKVICALIRH